MSTTGSQSGDISTATDTVRTEGLTTTSITTSPLTSLLLSSSTSSPPPPPPSTTFSPLSSSLASTTRALTDAITSLMESTTTTSTTKTTTTIAAALETTTAEAMTASLSTMLSTATTTTTLSSAISTSTSTSLSISNSTVFQNQTFARCESPLNISDEEREAYLAYLQNQTTKEMIPAMTYLIILAVVGIIGNSLVLIVYSRKFRRTATRVFIMSIAGFDLVTNIVVIPAEIYDMFHIWDFNQPILCKTRLFFNAFTTMVAAIVLVAVAVVRYRKICNPFGKQVSTKLAKILSVSIAVISLIFSVPYAIINGRQTRSTPRPGICGHECTTDDSYVNTIWPMVNSGFFILLFFSCCGPLVVLYICIGVKAWKHSKVYGVAVGSKGGHDSTTNNSTSGTVDTGTKSTEDRSLSFSMSTRTKSYVKKKAENAGDSAPAPSRVGSEKANGKTKKAKNSIRKAEVSRNGGNDDDGDNGDDANVIEYATDDSTGDKPATATTTAITTTTNNNNNNYSARMIRSPMGDKVQINLSMVRELTVKLKAVQKETEQRNDQEEEEKEEGENSKENASHDNDNKVVKFQDQDTEDQGVEKEVPEEEADDDKVALRNSKDKKKSQKANSSNNKTNKESKKTSSKHSRTLSKSMDDIFHLTGERRSKGKQKDGKTKAAENEDLDLPVPTNGSTDTKELNEDNGNAQADEEPLSEFAKAMQWVDITYCLTDNKRESAKVDSENTEDKDAQNVPKKTSFSISRKVSRDNSFLQRHRKLRETLTDTLTRARKSKKDRELAEAQNGNANGDIVAYTTNNEDENDAHENRNGEDDTDTISLKQNERKASKFNKSKQNSNADDAKEKSRSLGGGARRRGLGRTTCMLICISAVYILGFLPFLALMFIKTASPGTFESLSTVPQALYYLFLRSYFLNCAANPIVYSLCDASFRRECFQLLKCSSCKRRIY